MLHDTTRLLGVADLAAPIVVSNENHRFIVTDQLGAFGHSPSSILFEPMGRNTALAVAIATLQAMTEGYDPVLLCSRPTTSSRKWRLFAPR
jgi:mannose-1-phosphate guanylyltransferase/mannose-6-phosphate isomerase